MVASLPPPPLCGNNYTSILSNYLGKKLLKSATKRVETLLASRAGHRSDIAHLHVRYELLHCRRAGCGVRGDADHSDTASEVRDSLLRQSRTAVTDCACVHACMSACVHAGSRNGVSGVRGAV
jgi:hypothetical protein